MPGCATRSTLDVQSLWSDDGIALHFPDADTPPPVADLLLEPDEIEELLLGELAQSALYGSRFRENAARALLIPRRRPGQRTPLWQQRLKAQSLLQVARRYPQFPIVLETFRECLQDVFDLPALRGILRGIQTRELAVAEVETASASPFASSLLFDYVATYMYEDDTPPEERRAQALSLDRDLLRELMGIEELRELLDLGAIEQVDASLRPSPRNVDELHDLLRRVGPLVDGEYDRGYAETLLRERRAIRVKLGEVELLAAVEDAGLVRDAFGVVPPGGVPNVFLEPVEEPLRAVLRRYARTHGPFTTGEVADRFLLDAATVEAELGVLELADQLVRGELRPGGSEREWCDPEVLRRIRRATLAVLRREVEPAEQAAFGRFLPAWHGIGRRQGLREALVPLQGLALPATLWESDVLPRRVPSFRPAELDVLCASGEVVWVGAGLDRVARLLPRRRAAARAAPGRSCSGGRGRRCDSRRARRACALLGRPRRGDGAAGRGRPRRPLGARLGGRGHERLVGAAARLAALRAAAPGPRRPAVRSHAPHGRRRRRRGGGRSRRGSSRRRPIAGRSPSSCSSGRASSRETAFAARGSAAGTAPCTRS